MKDSVQDELELRLYNTSMDIHGHLPAIVMDVINDALNYVRNNPSIRLVEAAADELEHKVIAMGEDDYDFEGVYEGVYEDARCRLDMYREAVLIMEELA